MPRKSLGFAKGAAALNDTEKFISVAHGRVQSDILSVYSVVRNEMFFLPSFLEHYRGIGIRQFVFLDDRSDDGTLEYLRGQPDCVVLASPLRFGDKIEGRRAVHLWRTCIPQKFFADKWAICADADEFLFFPPQFKDAVQFVRYLDEIGATAVAAVMVDFYPESIAQIESHEAPRNLSDLFATYAWFDAGPYYRWPADHPRPIILHGGVRERLLKKFVISKRDIYKTPLQIALRRLKSIFVKDRNVGSIHKVPLVKWTAGREYLHSHTLNEPPNTDFILPIAHFKFTSFLNQKIEQALSSKAYSKGSRTYFAYAELLKAMRQGDGSFLDARSMKFSGVEDFVAADLAKFPVDVSHPNGHSI